MALQGSTHHGLDFSQDRLAEFCKRHRIRRLALFGSVLREDFGPNSDVDVLVEFEPGVRTGFKFFAIQQELAEIIGRKVDLNTPECLSKYFRHQVLAEAEVQYAAR
jgi:predicted nucleotidyltransferase